MFLFCLVFAMSLCASVYMCFVVTCWERADLLALVSIPDLCTLTYLDLGVKVTRNVAQYPLHHVTYSATKFEVAMPKGLGDAFTRKFNL